jgi:hypothetical protein
VSSEIFAKKNPRTLPAVTTGPLLPCRLRLGPLRPRCAHDDKQQQRNQAMVPPRCPVPSTPRRILRRISPLSIHSRISLGPALRRRLLHQLSLPAIKDYSTKVTAAFASYKGTNGHVANESQVDRRNILENFCFQENATCNLFASNTSEILFETCYLFAPQEANLPSAFVTFRKKKGGLPSLFASQVTRIFFRKK